MMTQFKNTQFKRKFYAAVSIIFHLHALIHYSIQVSTTGAHFVGHTFNAAQYVIVDQPELAWRGILRSWEKNIGILRQHAQMLVKWDPHYGFLLLHNYTFTSNAITVGHTFDDSIDF